MNNDDLSDTCDELERELDERQLLQHPIDYTARKYLRLLVRHGDLQLSTADYTRRGNRHIAERFYALADRVTEVVGDQPSGTDPAQP